MTSKSNNVVFYKFENRVIGNKHKNMVKAIKTLTMLLCSIVLSSCMTTKTQQIYNDNKTAFEQKINSFIGKTPNELYAEFGKPNEYTADINTDKQIKNANIIYEKVYNFNLKQYECLITFYTDKTQTKIVNTKYNSDKCYYLAQF